MKTKLMSNSSKLLLELKTFTKLEGKMSDCHIYLDRLEKLSHGFIREQIPNTPIPNDIVKAIQKWHSNEKSPKLIFDLLLVTSFNSANKIFLECYLDEPHWNILNICRFSVSYDIYTRIWIEDELANWRRTQAQGAHAYISNYYNDENLIAMFGIDIDMEDIGNEDTTDFEDWLYGDELEGTFELYAKDADNNILIKAEIKDIPLRYCYRNDAVRLKGEVFDYFEEIEDESEKISLKEWMSLKDKLDIYWYDLLWRRIFYLANHMSDEYRERNFYLDEYELRETVCQYAEYFLVEEYQEAIQELVC